MVPSPAGRTGWRAQESRVAKSTRENTNQRYLGDPKGGALAPLGLQRTSLELSNQNSTTTHSTNGYALASIPANAKMTRSNLIGTRTKKQIPRHSEGLDLVVASPWRIWLFFNGYTRGSIRACKISQSMLQTTISTPYTITAPSTTV